MANNRDSTAKLSRVPILRGLVLGLLIGVIARLWMRWISTDPEFTWGGTLGIVIGFGIFGMVQATVRVFVENGHRKWSTNIARALGVFFSLQLFVAAGAVMFPAVLAGVLALWRDRWPVLIRNSLGVLSIGWVIFIIQTEIVHEFGLNMITVGKIILMLAIYLWIIASLKSAARGRN